MNQHDREFTPSIERQPEEHDSEMDAEMDAVISEEIEFIEAIQYYDRCGRTNIGKQHLIERIDYLLGRSEDWARERLEDRRRHGRDEECA